MQWPKITQIDRVEDEMRPISEFIRTSGRPIFAIEHYDVNIEYNSMVALHGSTEYIGGLLPNIVDEKVESNLKHELQLNFKAHLQSLTIKIQNLIEEQRKQK